jgi:hypothetical protein
VIATATAGISVVVMDVRLKQGVRAIVAAKVAAGQCLCCEEPSAGDRLGLCSKHYQRFRTALLEKPIGERETFRAQLIRDGKLLPSRQGQRTDIVNEFREV